MPPPDASDAPPGTLRLRSLGNAGIELRRGARRVYIDAYFVHAPHVGGAPILDPDRDPLPELLLFTHHHPDHCLPSAVGRAARRAEAEGKPFTVAGPEQTLKALAAAVPGTWTAAGRLVALEPRERRTPPDLVARMFGDVSVTALRTCHGPSGHNSYLLDWNGVRVFHDGDNEQTRPLPTGDLGPVDALCLCPWQGSDAAGLLERWKPGRWILIHMTPEELDDHARGAFLPPLLGPGPVPEAVGLRPGEEIEIAAGRR